MIEQELLEQFEQLCKKLKDIIDVLNPADAEINLKQKQELTTAQNFWNDNQRANKILKEIKNISDKLDRISYIRDLKAELSTLIEILTDENDPELLKEFSLKLNLFSKKIEEIELATYLALEEDKFSAILSIHPGAGGTESCDWANMLLRMYMRWSEINNFKATITDLLPGEEAGIKSVDIMIEGEYSYGYLKGEIGIHRLVRISPFDANKRRHTSFASVYVLPEIDDDIDVDINDKDLRIDTYRSSSAGGQHVNVTDSAVRITHLPTGIVVQCQNERSQHQNKAVAMKILRSRLYNFMKEQQEKEIKKKHAEKADIAWGNQIRSYVFHPYSLIKDHRTNLETGNVNSVMDGNIDPFISAFLKWNSQK